MTGRRIDMPKVKVIDTNNVKPYAEDTPNDVSAIEWPAEREWNSREPEDWKLLGHGRNPIVDVLPGQNPDKISTPIEPNEQYLDTANEAATVKTGMKGKV